MVYRIKARSSTPGEFRLKTDTLSQLTSLSDIKSTAYRGDGGQGTLDMSLYVLMTEIHWPLESKVQKDVIYGIDTSGDEIIDLSDAPYYFKGSLVGIVDASGLFHETGIYNGYIWLSDGIIDISGAVVETGVYDGTTAYPTGIYDGYQHHKQGILDAYETWYPVGIFDGSTLFANTMLNTGHVRLGIPYNDSDGQHEGTLAVAVGDNVREGVESGNEFGTMIVPTAGVLKLGEHAGWYHPAGKDPEEWEVTGTYDPMSLAVWPAEIEVDKNIDFGPTGTEYKGTGVDATAVQNACAAAIAADKTGYKLAADGLDSIADPDSLSTSSIPSTFTQKLRWLIQRFWKADKTSLDITVKNEAGDTITTQAITSDGDIETLGAPQ